MNHGGLVCFVPLTSFRFRLVGNSLLVSIVYSVGKQVRLGRYGSYRKKITINGEGFFPLICLGFRIFLIALQTMANAGYVDLLTCRASHPPPLSIAGLVSSRPNFSLHPPCKLAKISGSDKLSTRCCRWVLTVFGP